MHDTDRLRAAIVAAGQGHVLAFWNEFDKAERESLLEDISRLRLEEIPRLARLATESGIVDHAPTTGLEPPHVVPRDAVPRETSDLGSRLIAQGRVAALTVAGGQGTRLGFDGPKGAFRITPVRDKPLFQLFAEQIAATDRRYNSCTPWYIMTSPGNDAATREFFAKNNDFGLAYGQVHFFQQGVMPAFSRDGRILLDKKHRLALSPDGHGGTLLAVAASGMLRDMADRGVEYISYFQVDNPLVRCLDPTFVGLHATEKSDMSGKTLSKADDLERVGNFAVVDGRLTVIEYTDFPETLARSRNPDGSRRFDAANMAVHILSRSFIERLTADPSTFALPWHRAIKKVPSVDMATGRRVEPDEPNAIKLESFIFDALPLANRTVLMGTRRDEEFSPVKNPTGVDSVESARHDLIRRAAKWLDAAGIAVPRTPNGTPDGRFEISPLFALDADELTQRRPALMIHPGDSIYLG